MNSVSQVTSIAYGTPLKEMAEVAKCLIDGKIGEDYFSTVDSGDVTMPHLHKFVKSFTCDEVVAQLEAIGLRPATAEELLLFVANNDHKIWKNWPILALGSKLNYLGKDTRTGAWRNCWAPILGGEGSLSVLRSYPWFGDKLGSGCFYAVVYK